MTPRTYKLKKIKALVEDKWENPNARVLENHYKFLRKIARDQYEKSLEGISDETLEDLLQTIVYSDRYLRRKRQGTQNKLKSELVKEFMPTLR